MLHKIKRDERKAYWYDRLYDPNRDSIGQPLTRVAFCGHKLRTGNEKQNAYRGGAHIETARLI